MSKQNYTHIAIVMDRSGSMRSIEKDMSGGLLKLVEDQKSVKGDATLTLAKFDQLYELVYDFEPLNNVDDFELIPRGMTALLDAMGKTIVSVKEKIDSMKDDDKPSKCIFIFITDGQENSSTKYSKSQITEMIENCQQCEDVHYDFVFLGANQDAIAEGSSYGIRGDASLTYGANTQGTNHMYDSLSRSLKMSRETGQTLSFCEQDRSIQNSPIDIDKI